ncbi:hypothetical protein HU147_19090 [Planomicrobium chinense]|nr:hypothetical protein [Planococcus chinensis]
MKNNSTEQHGLRSTGSVGINWPSADESPAVTPIVPLHAMTPGAVRQAP